MCGIVGIVDGKADGALSPLLDILAHRGPDGRGTWGDARHAFGHTRLAIIDLAGGAQPMSDGSGRRHIVFNGEIYNYRQLRRAAGEKSFHTESDTEAILNLAGGDEPPETWVRRLDGMFAFALADGDDCLLARDPLGIKPLYMGQRDAGMAFASEIKALAGVSEKVTEFPPGHVYTRKGGLRKFYSIHRGPEDVTDPERARVGLLQRLDAAVRKRLIADVPVGVFLSGGLDSSIIAALARRHKKPLDTFCVGTRDSEDLMRAREAAEFLGTNHHERVYTIEEAIAVLPQVIYHLESFDCALVRSAVPNYFLAKLAAEHVKVALAGEGADELFAGYEYLKSLSPSLLRQELLDITQSLHNTNLQRCDRMSMAHGLEVRVPFLDVRLVNYAFRMPIAIKQHGSRQTEKWILRKAAEALLPRSIAWRKKLKFAAGAGLGDSLSAFAGGKITDREFALEMQLPDGTRLRSKEELLYYRIFRGMYPGESLLPLVGRSRSV